MWKKDIIDPISAKKIYFYILFGFPLVIREVKRAKTSVSVMPCEVAVRAPLKIPVMPSASIAFLTPPPIAPPKPIRGRLTPSSRDGFLGKPETAKPESRAKMR